ncbi:type IV pilus biogenesis protein PilM [Pseudomonas cichorii]|uniref:type IV pilus biogenesis protein PilM n=1 Tax=Pseudomonas cichorii TaxID=36746 RepID=UPI0018E5F8D1|nr:type IV pilus biogenesis protein PilM [Pseudomonas cichorii]
MPIYWIIILLIGISANFMQTEASRSEHLAMTSEVSAIARNILIYRNALSEYAHANPGLTGSVNDTALLLPTWFTHLSGVNGYVVTGTSYTFYASPPNGLVTELAALTENSAAVGYASSGLLVSPSGGLTGIPLPTVIPTGAVVAYH